MKDHAQLSEIFNQDNDRVSWHDETLWFVRTKRDRAANKFPGWELLRDAASQVKENVLSNLDTYLESFEAKAIQNSVRVHWAENAAEHNDIVLSILREKAINTMVKSKSMLTEECGLNDFLQHNNIEVIDTDLGERIVQLRNEPPSHIVLPAIHLKKEDVSDTFHKHLNTQKGNYDAQYLTEAARINLRDAFLTSKAALTGVNFAIAETGEFVVCTNEGNADMGAHLAQVHIASMGIEKVIPKREHLSLFLNLLARSATGQLITTYSSHFKRPRDGQEMHIIIVDNGRTDQLKREDFRNSLKCIRCGACMNTCPVYRRSGGHSYHAVVAGPIGSILAPNIDMDKNKDLPFASTLCGSCSNVCPVKIDIHDQLYKWRQKIVQSGGAPASKTIAMQAMAVTLSNPGLYDAVGRVTNLMLKHIPLAINNRFNPWYKQRDIPKAADVSFKNWYRENRKTN